VTHLHGWIADPSSVQVLAALGGNLSRPRPCGPFRQFAGNDPLSSCAILGRISGIHGYQSLLATSSGHPAYVHPKNIVSGAPHESTSGFNTAAGHADESRHDRVARSCLRPVIRHGFTKLQGIPARTLRECSISFVRDNLVGRSQSRLCDQVFAVRGPPQACCGFFCRRAQYLPGQTVSIEDGT